MSETESFFRHKGQRHGKKVMIAVLGTLSDAQVDSWGRGFRAETQLRWSGI